MRTFLDVRDEDLLRRLDDLLTQERMTTAEMLAVIAEVDARRLYAPAGYPSMFAFCVEKFRLSEDASYKRIQAARAARRFPALLDFIYDGGLHLTALCLLAPHLTEENVDELIEAATYKRKVEIEELLARRFGRPEVPTRIRVITPIPAAQVAVAHAPTPSGAHASFSMLAAMPSEVALEQVGDGASAPVATVDETLATAVTRNGPAQASEDQDAVAMAETQPALSPLNRYLLQCPISKETHDLLRYAQALLSHAIPDGEMDQLLQRALKALIPQLEKGKVAVLTRQPAARQPVARRSVAGQSRPQVRKSNRPSCHGTELPAIAHAEGTSRRPIPAEVRRAVWERDKRQCTFVGTNGHRCGARRLLEFDHINPVARGGASTVNNIRLRCRAHNQYEAERVLGADLMTRKREARTEAMKSTSGRGSPTCSGAS